MNDLMYKSLFLSHNYCHNQFSRWLCTGTLIVVESVSYVCLILHVHVQLLYIFLLFQVYNQTHQYTKADDLLVKAKMFRAPLVQTLSKNSTMLHVYTSNEKTTAILGTYDGEIMKVIISCVDVFCNIWMSDINYDTGISALPLKLIYTATGCFITNSWYKRRFISD